MASGGNNARTHHRSPVRPAEMISEYIRQSNWTMVLDHTLVSSGSEPDSGKLRHFTGYYAGSSSMFLIAFHFAGSLLLRAFMLAFIHWIHQACGPDPCRRIRSYVSLPGRRCSESTGLCRISALVLHKQCPIARRQGSDGDEMSASLLVRVQLDLLVCHLRVLIRRVAPRT